MDMNSYALLDVKVPLGRRRSRSVGNLTTTLLPQPGPPSFNSPVYSRQAIPNLNVNVHQQIPPPVPNQNVYANTMLKMINSLLSETEKHRLNSFENLQEKIEMLPTPPPRLFGQQQQQQQQQAINMGVNIPYGQAVNHSIALSSPGSYMSIPGGYQPPIPGPINASANQLKFGPSSSVAPYNPVSPPTRSPRPGTVSPYMGSRPQPQPIVSLLRGGQKLDYNHPVKSVARKRSSSLSCLSRLGANVPVPVLNFDLQLNIPNAQANQQWGHGMQQQQQPVPVTSSSFHGDRAAKLAEFESFLDFPEPHISEAERKMGRGMQRRNTPVCSNPNSAGICRASPGPSESYDAPMMTNSDCNKGGLAMNLQDIPRGPIRQEQRPMGLSGWLVPPAAPTPMAADYEQEHPLQNAFRQMSIVESENGENNSPGAGPAEPRTNYFGLPVDIQPIQNPDPPTIMTNDQVEMDPLSVVFPPQQAGANRSVSGIIREVLGTNNPPPQPQQPDIGSDRSELMRFDTEDLYALIGHQ